MQFLKEIIVGEHNAENVVLLEIKPHEQKTRIDFYCTRDYLHIPIVCLTELEQEGKKLFYRKDGRKIEIKRIYNRIIFDELSQPKQVSEMLLTSPSLLMWSGFRIPIGFTG